MKTLFLRWLLLQAVTLAVVVPAALSYDNELHIAAVIALGAVLSVFVLASLYAGLLCFRESKKGLQHVSLGISILPMIAMAGTAAGFLIAFGGGVEDVQQRVEGASTGIITTVVGVICTILLMLQRHLIESAHD